MKVTITVGQTSREVEVRSDLLDAGPSRVTDIYQDAAMAQVGVAFIEAYHEEVRRAKEKRSRP